MKPFMRFRTGSTAVTTAALVLLLSGCAAQQPLAQVPDSLKPGTDETLSMIVPAKGVQIYECRAKKDQSGYEWAFVAPEAALYGAYAKPIGHHYAGPQWESDDGSRILGSVKARADAPAANAIPWLLLSAKSTGPQGAFSQVTSVQRVNTAGGVAPAIGCTQSAAGKSARIDYTADYYFFTRK
jgi:hypothetical protein